MDEKSIKYQQQALNPFLFKLGMLRRLPSVAFWGIRICVLNAERCEVTIPFTWRTQNPFGSIYFGALAGAAELSTGALCQMMIKGMGDYAMLVVGFKAQFVKKATTTITFSCDDGIALAAVLGTIKNSGDTASFEMTAIGKNAFGDIIGSAHILWSFKKR